MTNNKAAPGGTKPAVLPTLLQIVRDLTLYPMLRALLSDQITRMTIPGSIRAWTYFEQGDEVVVSDEQVAILYSALAATTGRPLLKPTEKRISKGGAFVTLQLPDNVKTEILREVLALLAHLSADDLTRLPPPLDIQEAEERRRWEAEKASCTST